MLGHGMMEILSQLLAASIKTLSWCVGFMWHLMVRSAWCLLWGSRLAWAANKTEEAAKNWGKKHPPGNETNISHLGEVRNIIDSKVPNGRGYVNFCGGYFCEVRVFPWRKTLQKWNLHQDQSTGDVPFLSVESSVLEGLNGAFRMLPESQICNEMLEPWMLWHRFVAIYRPT